MEKSALAVVGGLDPGHQSARGTQKRAVLHGFWPVARCLAVPGLLILLANCGGGGAPPSIATTARSNTIVSTVAGSGVAGSMDGIGTTASFYHPHSVVPGTGPFQGAFIICEDANNSIRLMQSDGSVTTLAGSAGPDAFADGHGTSARFADPEQVAVDDAGDIYVTDRVNNRIRRITPAGDVSTIAGTGASGNLNGAGDAAMLANPIGVACSQDGSQIYVAETYDIRLLTYIGGARDSAASYRVTTLAGTGSPGFVDGIGVNARFGFLHHMALVSSPSSSPVVYVTDTGNNAVRRVDIPASGQAVVTTIAGTGVAGSADSTGDSAQFSGPAGIAAITLGNGRNALFVTDNTSGLLRAITYSTAAQPLQKSNYTVTTLAGHSSGHADGDGNSALFNGPDGIAAILGPSSSITLYIAEFAGNQIRKAVVSPSALLSRAGNNH